MPKAGSTPGAIIRSARQKKGLTGADLGRLVGTSKETIHKIEKGLTRNSSVLPEIARVLELPLSAFAGQPGSTKGHDDNEARTRPLGFVTAGSGIPLYPCAERAEGMVLVNFEPIDFLKRPAPLMHVQGAYAVLVDGSAMVPALEPGDTALINPRLFPRKNMSGLFLEASEESVRGAFRRYEGQSERVWRVFQWQPQRSGTLERSEWPRVHAVVGKYSWR
jgi:transcriptional regulator with XRE-family HTH domain